MDKQGVLSASLHDMQRKMDRIQADIARLLQQKVPDRFMPINEAIIHLHCGRDWLVAQIKGDVLRPGIDYLERTSKDSTRKRYLVNPISALRWLNTTEPVSTRNRHDTKSASSKIA